MSRIDPGACQGRCGGGAILAAILGEQVVQAIAADILVVLADGADIGIHLLLKTRKPKDRMDIHVASHDWATKVGHQRWGVDSGAWLLA